MTQKRRDEDKGLAPEQFGELNRRFFTDTHGPHVFILHRLRGALLAASGHEATKTAFADGLTVGTLTMSGDWADDEAADDDLEQFAALEAVVLFHHAAETLLRLTLALEEDAACPWLEVTRLRQPRVFPERVTELMKRLHTDETQDRLARIFYFRKDRNTPPEGIAEADWKDALDGITALLAECARRYKLEGGLYNSAKHGLSAVQGHAGMRFGNAESGDPLISADGTSLTILEVKQRAADGRRQWNETTHWIEADRTFALTYLLAQQIRNLWLVARRRYLSDPAGARLQPLSSSVLTQLLHRDIPADGPAYQFVVPSMSMNLLYFKEEAAETPPRRRSPNARKRR